MLLFITEWLKPCQLIGMAFDTEELVHLVWFSWHTPRSVSTTVCQIGVWLRWQIGWGKILQKTPTHANTDIHLFTTNKRHASAVMCTNIHIWMRSLCACVNTNRTYSQESNCHFAPLSWLFALTTAHVAARLITICLPRYLTSYLHLPVGPPGLLTTRQQPIPVCNC